MNNRDYLNERYSIFEERTRKNFGEELILAETTDNINFTAKVNLSVFDGADIDLIIEDGDIH